MCLKVFASGPKFEEMFSLPVELQTAFFGLRTTPGR